MTFRLSLSQQSLAVVWVVEDFEVVHRRGIGRLGGRRHVVVHVRRQRVVVPLGQDGKLPMGCRQFGDFRRDLVIGTRRVQRQEADHRPSEVIELKKIIKKKN